jgi:hypothetical protein
MASLTMTPNGKQIVFVSSREDMAAYLSPDQLTQTQRPPSQAAFGSYHLSLTNRQLRSLRLR